MTTVLEQQLDGVRLHVKSFDNPGAGQGESGEIAWITIERPERANAMSSALIDSFLNLMALLAERKLLRAVVLTGQGSVFVAGADIHEMAEFEPATGRAFITKVHRACLAVRDLPVPVIAQINGLTLGAGVELAAACDFRIAADSARFGMPEVCLGIPSVVEAALLPALIGWGETRKMLLLGELIDAQEALRIGLVETIAQADECDAVVHDWLRRLLANGPVAVRQQKALIRRWETLEIDQAIGAGIDSFEDAWKTPEPNRMMQSWLAQRRASKTK